MQKSECKKCQTIMTGAIICYYCRLEELPPLTIIGKYPNIRLSRAYWQSHLVEIINNLSLRVHILSNTNMCKNSQVPLEGYVFLYKDAKTLFEWVKCNEKKERLTILSHHLLDPWNLDMLQDMPNDGCLFASDFPKFDSSKLMSWTELKQFWKHWLDPELISTL